MWPWKKTSLIKKLLDSVVEENISNNTFNIVYILCQEILRDVSIFAVATIIYSLYIHILWLKKILPQDEYLVPNIILVWQLGLNVTKMLAERMKGCKTHTKRKK